MLSKTQKWMVAAGLGGISLMALVRLARLLGQRRKSQSWPIVQGRITESSVVEEEVPGNDYSRSLFVPKITYAYTVDGATFTGHRIEWFDDVGSDSRRAAQKNLANYPVGQVVNVFYDPADPASAALEPWRMKGIAIVIAVAAGAGLGCLFIGWEALHDPY